MLNRFFKDIDQYLSPNRVLVIYGARRVGKTTLVKNYLKNSPYKSEMVTGDNIQLRAILESGDFNKIKSLCNGIELLVIDEAQLVNNIGQALKIIVDYIDNIRVIATGSSSFDLANKVGEPLVGRKRTITLYPLSQLELSEESNNYNLQQKLSEYLRYGAYPEILMTEHIKDKREYLTDIAQSYLFKDIMAMDLVKNPIKLQNLVKILALNIGRELSHNELAQKLELNTRTISHYLDLLEKNFIITRLNSFSRNLAKELNKKSKYYFYDLGVRNAVIDNFNDLDIRNDIGALWENFVILERIKRNSYLRDFTNYYFWRTYDKKEIDLIEEKDGFLYATEMKYSPKAKISNAMNIFKENYAECKSTQVINHDNYLDFVL